MKKLICALLCMMLVIPSALAETPAKRLTEDDPAYQLLCEKCMEMVTAFDEALRDDEYVLASLEMQNAASYRDDKTLQSIREMDFTQPLDVMAVRADKLLASYDPDGAEAQLTAREMSPARRNYLGLYQYQMNALALGQMSLSLEEYIYFTVLSLVDAWVCPVELDGPCYVLLRYGGDTEDFAYLVIFYPTESGAVYVLGSALSAHAVDELNLPE